MDCGGARDGAGDGGGGRFAHGAGGRLAGGGGAGAGSLGRSPPPDVGRDGGDGGDGAAQALAAAFDRYGPAAVQLAAGPFAAVHLGYGTVVRAINGIVPVYVARQGSWVASTSAAVVGALSADRAVEPLPPGASVSPSAEIATWGPIAPDPAAGDVPWAWIERSVRERVAGHGALSEVPGQADVWCTAADHALYLPRLTAPRHGPDPAARYAHLRREALPRLWWTARLAGRWLFAPAFERPVLDAIAMLRLGPPPRQGPPS